MNGDVTLPWCVTFSRQVIDSAHTEQGARDLRSDIYLDVKAGNLPDFLPPEAVDSVGDEVAGC